MKGAATEAAPEYGHRTRPYGAPGRPTVAPFENCLL